MPDRDGDEKAAEQLLNSELRPTTASFAALAVVATVGRFRAPVRWFHHLPRLHCPVLKYWRTKDKAEVDFVIEAGKDLTPVEVKYQHLKQEKVAPTTPWTVTSPRKLLG